MRAASISGRDVKRHFIGGAFSAKPSCSGARCARRRPPAAIRLRRWWACVKGCVKVFHGVVKKAETKGDRGHTYTDAELEGTRHMPGTAIESG